MVAAADESLHVGHKTGPHLLDPEMPANTHQFFAIYYLMTGLHGIHVLIGVGVIGWLLWGSLKGRYGSDYYTPVDLVGLYWHVVDLVWIFLFPLFYLIH
jgi:cytochrome c oxidase subunit 3